ncbi:MAG: UDP-N-acetylmuramate--L-alanine ligase [Bacteroidales bacterium]|jgi:UDP-N-acetylmuramate--alanine ligase|nr:UDP-N-acetylmuramate--L-alanine ligase [Bacteroidales bacterium]
MKTVNGQQVFFLGIGGIGMSAIARFFVNLGAVVSGYDRTPSALTAQLMQDGVSVFYDDDPDLLPDKIDLAVVTPAVPLDSELYKALKNKKVNVIKRSQVLGILSEEYFTVAIAGTHGKTTITALTAHIFQEAGLAFNGFIGGIANNFKSNLVIHPDAKILLVEADEFDRSFLTLNPDIALISSVEADHLDIYGDHSKLVESFIAFAERLPENGKLILQQDQKINTTRKSYYYGLSSKSNVFAADITIKNFTQDFKLHCGIQKAVEVSLALPGLHNLNNALAATSIAVQIGIEPQVIANALATFKGVKRRFDMRVNNEKHNYIDDYAHHPTEIKACLSALRSVFPDSRITAVFQPHLFSRTRDLIEEFSTCFGDADQLLLLDIYPAREKPIPGVNSAHLLDKISLDKKWLVQKAELLPTIERLKPQVLVTMGAGDIDRFVEPIEKMMQQW